MLEIGDSYRKRYLFTAENIRELATAIGDNNPVHHDPAMAEATRFGGIIAAAGHATAVFVSVLAEWMTRGAEAYGLEFSHKLKRAVPAGLDAIMEWRVTERAPVAKLGGDIVKVEGALTDDSGRIYIEAKGAVLFIPPKPASM